MRCYRNHYTKNCLYMRCMHPSDSVWLSDLVCVPSPFSHLVTNLMTDTQTDKQTDKPSDWVKNIIPFVKGIMTITWTRITHGANFNARGALHSSVPFYFP